MTEVICFLDQHEGSLMVLITAVYVLATILKISLQGTTRRP